ncbi:hypothetical protein VTJ04DRAFT_9771 [Mycothermus thermophilus]|uniref:uncharacterized protein n=1 Tax=Humicola insolens TaxID=85995 RepID=UPI0037435FAD
MKDAKSAKVVIPITQNSLALLCSVTSPNLSHNLIPFHSSLLPLVIRGYLSSKNNKPPRHRLSSIILFTHLPIHHPSTSLNQPSSSLAFSIHPPITQANKNRNNNTTCPSPSSTSHQSRPL